MYFSQLFQELQHLDEQFPKQIQKIPSILNSAINNVKKYLQSEDQTIVKNLLEQSLVTIEIYTDRIQQITAKYKIFQKLNFIIVKTNSALKQIIFQIKNALIKKKIQSKVEGCRNNWSSGYCTKCFSIIEKQNIQSIKKAILQENMEGPCLKYQQKQSQTTKFCYQKLAEIYMDSIVEDSNIDSLYNLISKQNIINNFFDLEAQIQMRDNAVKGCIDMLTSHQKKILLLGGEHQNDLEMNEQFFNKQFQQKITNLVQKIIQILKEKLKQQKKKHVKDQQIQVNFNNQNLSKCLDQQKRKIEKQFKEIQTRKNNTIDILNFQLNNKTTALQEKQIQVKVISQQKEVLKQNNVKLKQEINQLVNTITKQRFFHKESIRKAEKRKSTKILEKRNSIGKSNFEKNKNQQQKLDSMNSEEEIQQNQMSEEQIMRNIRNLMQMKILQSKSKSKPRTSLVPTQSRKSSNILSSNFSNSQLNSDTMQEVGSNSQIQTQSTKQIKKTAFSQEKKSVKKSQKASIYKRQSSRVNQQNTRKKSRELANNSDENLGTIDQQNDMIYDKTITQLKHQSQDKFPSISFEGFRRNKKTKNFTQVYSQNSNSESNLLQPRLFMKTEHIRQINQKRKQKKARSFMKTDEVEAPLNETRSQFRQIKQEYDFHKTASNFTKKIQLIDKNVKTRQKLRKTNAISLHKTPPSLNQTKIEIQTQKQNKFNQNDLKDVFFDMQTALKQQKIVKKATQQQTLSNDELKFVNKILTRIAQIHMYNPNAYNEIKNFLLAPFGTVVHEQITINSSKSQEYKKSLKQTITLIVFLHRKCKKETNQQMCSHLSNLYSKIISLPLNKISKASLEQQL